MESKEFKKIFGETAKANGFESDFGGWFKTSNECVLVLVLQKSNFGDYYQLMMKIYIQGVFGKRYSKTKELVKKEVGNVFRGEPSTYKDVFDFDETQEPDKRLKNLEKLFNDFIVPFSDLALSRAGLKELSLSGEIYLLPAVKEELEKLN